LKKMGVAVFVFSLVEITVSFGAGLLAGFALGWSASESVILGGVISVSSTAIIVSMLYRRRALTQSLGRMMCGALIVEDMFAILILSLMPSLAQGNLFSMGDLVLPAVKLAFLVVFVFAFATYLAPRLIDRVSHLEFDIDESGFLLSLSLGFAMAALAYGLGLSAGIGAFLLGLFIVGKRAKFVYERVHPLRVLFIIIFFVTMGMLVDPSQFLNPLVVLPTVGLAVTGKYVGSYLGAVLSGHRELAGDIAVEMNPRGEFSFILARGASSAGAARGLVYPIAGTLVLATTLVSVFVRFIQEKYRQVAKQADRKESDRGNAGM